MLCVKLLIGPSQVLMRLHQTFAKDSLQRELLKELYQAEVMNELMRESDHVVTRRKECVKMVSVQLRDRQRCCADTLLAQIAALETASELVATV